MRKFDLNGNSIIITSSKKIDDLEFNRAYQAIINVGDKLLYLRKSSIILIQDHEENFIVVERMNTDTITLHIHHEIPLNHVYKIG
ncbi:hypothetical protein [Bacillus sp. AFS040349]|uniref:hypothetical protein n=1 Tax=Bacillus sp. AFS040349 TaxID=2033502 RepID=UPI000BFBDF4A|nr:hypothetical protein [Bacillus sp. AFS040349]PGT83096.1 hypothetical protein COD11_13540 [Bacillus sp. AFS040349]